MERALTNLSDAGLDSAEADAHERIAAVMRERARRRALAVGESVFTSEQLPPHTSRRTFREACARIPTARKDGHVWTVDRAAWFAFRRGSRKAVVVRDDPPKLAEGSELDTMLEGAGIRASRLTPK